MARWHIFSNYSSIIFYFMSAPDKLPNGVKSLIRFSPNQTSIFMRGSISITSLVSSEAARTIAESVKRQQGSSLILHVLLVIDWVYQKWDFQVIFVKNLTNMKKSFVQLEFKSISSLILFQNPRPGFQVPNLTLVSIIYCSSNFQLCCKLLTTAYVLKLFRFEKKIILFLFVFHWVLLYFFPNKYPDPCQNRPGYSLVEEPITYVCNFEKKIQYLGFQIMQRQVY